MDLVLQGEVESYMAHSFVGEDLGAGGIFNMLQVLNHVREPDGQAVITTIGERVQYKTTKQKKE